MYQTDTLHVSNGVDSSLINTNVPFPDVYWAHPVESWSSNLSSIIYLLFGATICFLYILGNKYYTFWAQEVEVTPGDTATKKKFEGVIYIWYSWWNSLIFRICFFYGLFGAFLFIMVLLADLSGLGDISIPQQVVVKSGYPIIDFFFAGLVFAVFCYPILTGNLIGIFGLGFFENLFAKPTDTNIESDIDNSRRDYIKAKIRKFSKEIKRDYTIDDFKKRLKTWYNMQKLVDAEDDLNLAMVNADEKYPNDVVNYIGSVMKSFGDVHIRRALNFRL